MAVTRLLFSKKFLLILLLLTALIFRLWFIFSGRSALHADMTQMGLYAKHIMEKGELLIYVPFYQGAFDSYLLVPIFFIFGISPLSLKILPLLYGMLHLFSIYCLASYIFNSSVAIIALGLAVIAPEFVIQWHTDISVSYILIAAIGNFVIILALKIYNHLYNIRESRNLYVIVAIFGFLMGFCLWLHASFVYYLAAIFLFFILYAKLFLWITGLSPHIAAPRKWASFLALLLQIAINITILILVILLVRGDNIFKPIEDKFDIFHRTKLSSILLLLFLGRIGLSKLLPAVNLKNAFNLLWVMLFFILGNLPNVLYVVLGSGRLKPYQPISLDLALKNLAGVFKMALPILIGFYRGWGHPVTNTWLIGYLILPIYIVSFLFFIRKRVGPEIVKAKSISAPHFFLLCFPVMVLLIYIFHRDSIGMEVCPRYLLYLFTFLVVYAGFFIYSLSSFSKVIPILFCLAIIFNNLMGSYQAESTDIEFPSCMPRKEQQLIQYCLDNNLTRVSANFCRPPGGYWEAYLLSFLSREEVIFAPNPFTRYVRFPVYSEKINESADVAYLFSRREFKVMRKVLTANNIGFKEKELHPYYLLYGLQPDLIKESIYQVPYIYTIDEYMSSFAQALDSLAATRGIKSSLK